MPRFAAAGVLALALAAGAGAAPPSLARFNAPGRAEQLADRTLYIGLKESAGLPMEQMALRVLLRDPRVGISCDRLRANLGADFEAPVEARRAARAEVAARIEAETARPDFGERYLWYGGEGGRRDPDFWIYTTPHKHVARLYGEVVFEFQEPEPRGIDLNHLNREVYRWYQQLPLKDFLHPKKALIRNLMDLDEYVIPSHIPNGQVLAVDVHARLPEHMKGQCGRLSGRRVRRYQRGGRGDLRWVDLVDRRGRPVARFTLQDEVPPPAGPMRAGLPPEVAAMVSRLEIAGRPVRIRR